MSDFDRVAAGLDPKRLDAIKQQLMSRIVLTVEANTKPVTPVRTGALRRSVTGVVRSVNEGMVGSNLVYAPIVHRRKPFLEWGLAASRGTIERLMQQALAEWLGGIR